jgi:hypothetical protein
MHGELKKAKEIVGEVLNELPEGAKVKEPELVTELKQAIENIKKDNVEKEAVNAKEEDNKEQPVIEKTEEKKTGKKKKKSKGKK